MYHSKYNNKFQICKIKYYLDRRIGGTYRIFYCPFLCPIYCSSKRSLVGSRLQCHRNQAKNDRKEKWTIRKLEAEWEGNGKY